MLKVGDKLPNLTLPGTQGGKKSDYALGATQGKKKVIVFYPFAFTPN